MPLNAPTMLAKDAVFAALAECYVTIGTNRYNFAHAINLEASGKKNKVKVDILGRTTKGNKAAGIEYSGKMTMHYNSTILRKMLHEYQETAEDFYFTIEIKNSDKTSASGEQIIILNDVNLDDTVVAKFDAGGEILDEDVNFTFESFSINKEFNKLEQI